MIDFKTSLNKHLILATLFVLALCTLTLPAGKAQAATWSYNGCTAELFWENDSGQKVNQDNISGPMGKSYKAVVVFNGSNCGKYTAIGQGLFQIYYTTDGNFRPPANVQPFTNTCFSASTNTTKASVSFSKAGYYTALLYSFGAQTGGCNNLTPLNTLQIQAQTTDTPPPSEKGLPTISGETAAATDKSVTITWKTDIDSDSTVWLRKKDGSDGQKPSNTNMVKNHSIRIQNLSPETEYIYTVYSDTDGKSPVAEGSVHSFKTNAAGNTKPTTTGGGGTGGTGTGGGGGAPTPPKPGEGGYKATPPSVPELYNPLTSNSIIQLGFKMLKGFFAGVAGLALVFIVFGGVQLTVSRGNPEGTTKGKNTVIWALAGIVVATLSFSIVAVIQNLFDAF